MYQKFDFETFLNSISVMTGFTAEQIKTLLAYRDVKYLDETTAGDLTAELNKLRNEMIKANPSGFEIKRTQTPLFPLDCIEEVAGVLSLEELLLMVFIDSPNIKINGDSKIRPVVMSHRAHIAASLYERGIISYSRAFKLSGVMSPRGFYAFLNERKSERARQTLGRVGEDMGKAEEERVFSSKSERVRGPEKIRKHVKGPITDYTLEFPNMRNNELFPTVYDIRASDDLRKAANILQGKLGPMFTACMSPLYLQRSQELIEQEANICKFTNVFYGETEAAKLAKFLILALSDPHFDEMLGKRVGSGHRGPTLREMQFTVFLYFNYRDLTTGNFEKGLIQAHSRLINSILAHAYECNILKVDLDNGHYRTAEGERLYAMLQAEEIPLKGKYKDLIDWNALTDFRKTAMTLDREEQGLFMAVRFPDFISNPDNIINQLTGNSKDETAATVYRRKLAYSMFDKRAVSMEMAAELAGVPLEDFRLILGIMRAGTKKTSGPAGQKDFKASHPEGKEDVKR